MKAVIIDDEKNCREVISALSGTYTPDLEIVGEFDNGMEAIQQMDTLQPDILFLDIEMPLMNGFEFLELCPYQEFFIIFTTAYNEYAIQAIKHHAFDYLLKPIQRSEFIKTIQRLQTEKFKSQKSQIDNLLNHLQVKKDVKKIVLSTSEGLHFIETKDIMYVKGDGAYSHYVFADGLKLLVSKTLKEADAILPNDQFKRVHASYIINFDFVKRYQKGEGGFLIMNNGESIPVSRSKKQDLISHISQWM